MLAMALPGLRFLGQTLVQFIIVWQRYNLNASSSPARRSFVDPSRLSSIHLYACIRTAGPKYLSAFHQYEGHEVEQHAHKMHSYRPSSLARSSVACKFCNCPLSFALPSSDFCNHGCMDRYCW